MPPVTQNAHDLRVEVFRVEEGLGNAILLQFPDDTCAIVDWGTQSDEALRLVLDRTRKGIRIVVATHDHADHTLGLAELFDACKASQIRIDRFAYPTSHLRRRCHLSRARLKARELDIPTSSIGIRTGPDGRSRIECLAFDPGSWEMSVVAPLTTDAAELEVSSFLHNRAAGNRSSAVVLFAFLNPQQNAVRGAGKVLLPGDATNALLSQAAQIAQENNTDLHNQLLVVPHHGGSKVVPGWLNDYVHGIAVISGRTNSPHHPAMTTLQSLALQTCCGTPKRLFCTSYAQACRNRFASESKKHERHLVGEGPCFGHLTFRVPRDQPATLKSSSDPGEQRRPFGWCGNTGPHPFGCAPKTL